MSHSDRDKWRTPFRWWPSWTCSVCQRGHLRPDKKTLHSIETGESKRSHEDEGWEPEYSLCRFVLVLTCDNVGCQEVVTCTGDTSVVVDDIYPKDGSEPYQDYVEVFTPRFFNPPLRLFPLPDQCPDDVAMRLDRAFSLVWSDTAAAVNAMRTALEAVLKDRGIARSTVNRNRKRVPITLHDRIVAYGRKDTDGEELMMALKWLGNYGSHANETPPLLGDLLDGFMVFEHLLEHVYVQKVQAVRKLAGQMIVRKGRPKAEPKTKSA